MATTSRDDAAQPTATTGQGWSADELIPFGKYILLSKISSGATAAVYRAKIRGEAGFERLVVVKRILPHMAGDPEFVNTFVREAKTAARLNHTNICPIYELGKVGESLYMAMEWIAGKDLGAITRRLHKRGEVMPPVLAAFVAAKLCDALDYAHSLKDARGNPAGIIHRDLSPTNIMISYEGQVKLIDFGLAKAAGRAQQTNVDALKQKLGYMSPELVKGRAPDARSDLFGVGVCLYELVTGRRLFAGKDDIATLKMVSTASVPPPSALVEDAPEDLELIIMRALEREPEDRWQSASEMAQALAGFIANNDPRFGTQKAAEWMLGHFQKDMVDEQKRITELLTASKDTAVLEERKRFFASAAGAAALAKAEVARRMSTQPPPVLSGATSSHPPPSDTAARIVPGPPPLPRIAQAAAGRASPAPMAPKPPEKSRAATATFEDEPTSFLKAEHTAAPQRASAQDAVFEDEPTNFLDADALAPIKDAPEPEEATAFFASAQHAKDAEAALAKNEPTVKARFGAAPPAPKAPAAPADDDDMGYTAERTEFLGGDLLAAMVVDEKGAPIGDSGGFGDEDATHIFFNKEDGVGLSELSDESARPSTSGIQNVTAPAARLNAPIVSPQLMASDPSTAPRQSPVPRARTTTGRHPAAPPGAQAPAARSSTGSYPQAAATSTASRTRTQTMQVRVRPRSDNLSTVLLLVGVALLTLAVAGLVIKTPLGVRLGLRAPEVGAIEIRTSPVQDAAVKLDGVYRGRAPLRMDGVRAGIRTLELEAPGHVKVTRQVQLAAGTTAMIDIALPPKATAAP
jgi:serine/threonine protein kinase